MSLPCSNTQWVSLLPELQRFPDVKPTTMQGGGQAQPWLMPIYGVGTELEMMDWLYATVRLLKPSLIVEAGCHLGMGAYALGRAAQDNGKGRIITCDTDADCCATTTERCWHLPVEVRNVSADDVPEIAEADFLFLDSSYETRISSLSRLRPGAVAIVHDTRQSPELRPACEQHPHLHFITWRGFSIVCP